MSAPEARLIGDAAAERFEIAALAQLACCPLVYPEVESLAIAVIALCRDRTARIEVAGAIHNNSR